MANNEPKVSDWMIERLAKGELGAAQAEALRTRLARELGGEEAVAARLRAVAEDDRATLERLPAALVVPRIRQRAGDARPARRPARGLRLAWLSPLAAAAVAVLLYVGTKGPGAGGAAGDASGPAEERTKGATRLLAFRAGAEPDARAEQLGAEAPVRPHDLLQLAYVAGAARFGVVVSIDGGGSVTLHLPAAAEQGAAPLSPAGTVRLPRSYELDASPAFERFFLVTSSRPFSTGVVMAAAGALARTPADARTQALALPPELAQESLLLNKVTP